MPDGTVRSASLSTTLAGVLWPRQAAVAAELLRAAVLALAGTLLLTVSAKVQVPFYPVPMTMQTLVVLMLGAAYGWRLGTATVALYLVEGAFGLPVFAGTPEKGIGVPYMLGPTGGYLIGFVLGAALTGFLAEHGWGRSVGRVFVAMALGHLAVFVAGFAWLAVLFGAEKAWVVGVAPFYWATLLKTALGAALMPGLWSMAARRGA
ncbi:biotin transporter BioY [Chelatococcus sp. SYSU_G07232]|uniref:Biotin transporter n=1 Tax=Chelatococcus albus TaxID=3047466 RepID=A0ABT7AED5_9HYPH|nr:biotin transporter BioY [Chelatococcus sp. SYSU_G07232]MDJ1157725.1 biotin transporter BioY [Chelatococcus sp. SYSU_G07232]